MYKLLQIYCLVTVISGSSVFAAKIEALRDMPSQVQDLANAGEQDPNVPEDVFAQGVIAVEAAAPVVSVMSAATEVPEFKYRLTYRATEFNDGESWIFYQKYFVSDPNHPEREPDAAFLREQLALSLDEMDIEKVESHLNICAGKLDLLEQAVRCRTIVWPQFQHYRVSSSWRRETSYDYDSPIVPEHLVLKIEDIPTLLKQLDAAGLLLAAKARYHIGRGEYEQACRWLRAGLAQARQMTSNTHALFAMAGAVNVGRILGQIEAWIQKPGSPSLFRSLSDLPRPLAAFTTIDESKQSDDFSSFDTLDYQPEILSQSPLIVRNLERLAAALQCVEAIRLHAALYEGRIPETLTEITDVRVPLDPVTRQPFLYERRGEVFTLFSEDKDNGRWVEIEYRIHRTPQPDRFGMPGMPMF
jgi:hypothetical protein